MRLRRRGPALLKISRWDWPHTWPSRRWQPSNWRWERRADFTGWNERRLVLDSTSPRANNLRSAIGHLAKGRGGD
ncbi:MAG: hypothetical protein ACR2J5_00060 [Geodermatophilaceae bacterium]